MSSTPPLLVRKRLRAPGYDYSHGMYMVTICVHHMEKRFGAVRDGQMHVNRAGEIVDRQWQALSGRYPGMELDAYVVMPNHLHGILLLPVEPAAKAVSLSTVVGTFKSLAMAEYSAGVKDGQFPRFDCSLWLRSFRDQIIRNDRMLVEFRNYIEGNPGRWQEKYGES